MHAYRHHGPGPHHCLRHQGGVERAGFRGGAHRGGAFRRRLYAGGKNQENERNQGMQPGRENAHCPGCQERQHAQPDHRCHYLHGDGDCFPERAETDPGKRLPDLNRQDAAGLGGEREENHAHVERICVYLVKKPAG